MAAKNCWILLKTINSKGVNKFLLTALFALFLSASVKSQELASTGHLNIYFFAQHLFNEGDYERAAAEYFRYAYHSSGLLPDSIRYRIALCYALDAKWEQAENHFVFLAQIANSPYAEKSMFNLSLTHTRQGNYSQANQLIGSKLHGLQSPPIRHDILNLRAYNHLQQYDFPAAIDALNHIESPVAPLLPVTIQLKQTAEKGLALKYKKPWLAGTFSAIVPGSGKIYSKRTQDGIYSFALVGLMAWQAYTGFHDKGTESVKGWIYAAAGTVFYIGNIHGSVVSAKLFNQKINHELVHHIGIAFQYK
jgi:hypothetical protein